MQPSPKADPLLGSVLIGTYRIERLLGRGGMGAVYAAEHIHLQSPCAIKVLRREYSEEGEPLKRFQREAQITSHLGHPNIVRVTDFNFTPDGEPFMVMELLKGETLHRRLRSRGQLTLPEVVRLFGPLCDALGLAHDKGVVHRDLKPENIFLPEDLGLDGAKILDFGISKIRDGNTRLTKADMTMGTQSYMAPELVMGAAAEADTRSDVFSLGAILYEVLTARMAFDGPNGMAVMYKLLYQDPPSARAVDPSLPEEVDQVILRALRRNPAERTPSAVALFQELTEAALPCLPAAEDMEAQMSTPYRYTSGALRAVRVTGGMAPVRVGTGPHTPVLRVGTGPQRRQTRPQAPGPGGGPPTGPMAVFVPPPAGPAAPARGWPTAGRPRAGQPPEAEEDGPALGAGADPSDEVQEERARHKQRKGGGLVMAVILGLVLLTGAGLHLLRQRITAQGPASAPPTAAPTPTPPTAPPPPAAPPPAAETRATATAPAPIAEGVKEGREAKRKKRRRGGDSPRELPRLELPSAE